MSHDQPDLPHQVLNDFDDLSDDPPDLNADLTDDYLADDLFDSFDRLMTTHMGQMASSANQPSVATPNTEPPLPPKAPPRETDVVDRFPGAARVLRKESGVFECWDQKHGHATNPYHPFKDKLDWEVARWAKQEAPGATSMDRLLKCQSASTGLRHSLCLS